MQFAGQNQLGGKGLTGEIGRHSLGSGAAAFGGRELDGGQGRGQIRSLGNVIHTDDRHILRHPQAVVMQTTDG